MTAIKTHIGARESAHRVTHAPSANIPRSDTWSAIQYVYDWFAALVPSVGAAPKDAQYLVATADGTLTAERVTTDTPTVAWDHATAAQAKASVPDDAITFAKLQNITSDRLLGRDTASSGDPEEISVGGGLEFTGSAGIQRSALTGDVAASAGSNSTTIQNNAVTDAKLRDSAAVSVIGRSANSSGDPADIAAAANDTLLRRVSDAIGFGALTLGMIGANLITYAKIQQVSATSRFLGRITSGAGDIEELTGTQATSLLNNVVGDSGSGGTKGLVPAPGAGDAAAGKFLKADGTFATAGGGTLVPPLGRLSLSSGVPATEADFAGSTSVYWNPTGSQDVWIYDGADFVPVDTGGILTLALDSDSGHTGYQESGKNFDLWIISDSGTPRLGSGPAWNAGAGAGSNTARGTGAASTEHEVFGGVLVNKNTMTVRFGSSSGNTVSVAARRATYVGSMRMTANGQTDDTIAKRFVFNAYNSVARAMRRHDATASWSYSTASAQQANANAANKVEYLHGLSGIELVAESWGTASNSGATVRYPKSAIGIDALTQHADVRATFPSVTNTVFATAHSQYRGYPGLGYHAVNWLEVGAGADTQTWYGTSISGLHASTMM